MLGHKAARAARHTKGHDQRLPQWFIWPWARRSALQHDSYKWVLGDAELMMMMISVFQLRDVPRLCRLPDPETEHLQQLRGLRVHHRRQGDGRVPEAVQEAGPRGHLDTLLIRR